MLVSIMTDVAGVVFETKFSIILRTLDEDVVKQIRDVLLDLINHGETILRIEVIDKGMRTFLTVSDVMLAS